MRNAEAIRQWKILRTLDARRQGATVTALAEELGVTPRTIWRDMAALQEVGFPLTSDLEGRQTRWQLINRPFKGLDDLGVSTMELCALYMGRAMVGGLAGAPFGPALASLCDRIGRALPARMRAFLDRLPSLVEAKPGPVKTARGRSYERHLTCLLEASADRRACAMRYFSASRGAVKHYVVHPYRLVHAHGGMYLLAWVPEYGEIRTFALERIEKLSLQDDRFEVQAELAPEAFAHSLGVNRGTPQTVVLSFSSRMAPYIRERTWHASQRVDELPDGGVRMTLRVSIDAPLKAWILGFGPFARVESPSRLAEEILEQLERARDAYVPRLDLALPSLAFTRDQPRLPGLATIRPS